jgi:hypothetical protein
MTKYLTCAIAAAGILAACSTSAEQKAQPASPPPASSAYPNSDAKLLADFKAKVDDYVKLRNKLDNTTPPLKKTADPAAITDAEKTLAAKIRAERPQAKKGDFFTPATAALFKRLMSPAVKGPEGRENKAAVADDVPENVPFKVLGEYPKQQTVSTVPPDILMSLPTIQENAQVQYRFVGKHLVLYDARANLIMDYIFNAIP